MRRFLFWGRALVSLCLLWFLAARLGSAEVLAALRGLSPVFAGAAFLVVLLQILLGALRWGAALRIVGGALSPFTVLRLFWVGLFYGEVLPGAVGGDAVRVYAAKASGLPLKKAALSVGLERAFALGGLFLFCSGAAPFLKAQHIDLPALWIFPVGLALLVCAGGLVWRFNLFGGRSLFISLQDWGLGIGAALLSTACMGVCVFLLSRAMGLDLPLLACLVLVPVVALFASLPLSLSGWGVREAGFVAAFGLLGVDGARAFALSIAFGAVSAIASLFGALDLKAFGRKAS